MMPSEVRRRSDSGAPSSNDAPTTTNRSMISDDEAVRSRAYEKYEERGREQGHDLDDWLEAERELHETQEDRR